METLKQAGFRTKPYSAACGLSEQMLFKLWREGRGPHFVKAGAATIITESPSDFLARLGAETGQESPTAAVQPIKAPILVEGPDGATSARKAAGPAKRGLEKGFLK